MGVGLLLARRNLTRKFARTLFSILGIAVGIATVVGVFTLALSMQYLAPALQRVFGSIGHYWQNLLH